MTIAAKDGKIDDLSNQLNNCKAQKATSEAVNRSNASEIKKIKSDLADAIAKNKRLEANSQQAVKEAIAEKGMLFVQTERLRDRLAQLEQNDCSQHPVRDGFVELFNETIPAGSSSEGGAGGSTGGNDSAGT